MSEIIEETLSNGIRVVIDQGSKAGLVSVGFGFAVGSRYETQEENGLAHFFEHNIFNGTTKSSQEEIFGRVADMGSFLNAATGKSETIYYMDGQAHTVGVMIDVLTEIITNSVFPEDKFEKERGTVIQEIERSKGNPDIVFNDGYNSVLYPDQPLGRTILGPIENISAVPRNTMIRFFERNYNTSSMIVCVAGDVDPDMIMQQLEQKLSGFRQGLAPAFEKARMADPTYSHIPASYLPQTRTSLLYKGLELLDPNFMALRLGGRILGGGATSALFQKVRLDHGLVYNISSNASAWVDSGEFEIEFATTPDNMDKAMGIIKDTLESAVERFSESDLSRAKAILNTGSRFGYEKTEDTMKARISEIVSYGHVVPLPKYLEKLSAPTLDEVKDALQEVISTKPTMVTMGPEEASSTYHRFTLGLG